MNNPLPADHVTFFHQTRAFVTSAEVWAVLRARHGRVLKVFSTFSDPECGCMETTFSLPSAGYPLIGARTTWKPNPERPGERIDEQHEYFLFVAMKETE